MKQTCCLLLFAMLSFASCQLLRGLRPVHLVSAPHAPPARLLTVMPFRQLTGGVILLRGRINNDPDTLNFLLDTGSGGISLDSVTCRKLGLPTQRSDVYVHGIGGSRRLFFAYNNVLKLPGLETDSLDFHINDYAFLSAVYGRHIAGIIGYSFFKNYIVRLDYDQKKMWVYSPGRIAYPENGWLLRPNLGRIPEIAATLRNEAMPVASRFYFDLGAGLCLMLSNRFASDSNLFKTDKQRRHQFIPTEIQGFAGPMTMTETVLEKVQLGPYRFRKVPVHLFDDVSNVTNYPRLGGLMGNDLLRRFNTIINYPQGEIYLVPNKHFKEPFDYSYTGLSLYFLDGKVVVTKVLKDSPGDQAGFVKDDVVLAVNGDFSNDIHRYHEMLKGVGKTVLVLVLRDGQPLQLRLKIKSVL